MVKSNPVVDKFTYKYIKRLMDIIISVILISLLIPFLLIIALIIKITSNGSAYYNWDVLGKNGVQFRSWKFRTMVNNADKLKNNLSEKNEMIGPVFKIKNDPRITKVGKFLRKYSLDELLQLISVIKGDMSLVGPRPAGPHEFLKYETWQKRRLSVMPGLTGPWQVNGRNRVNNFDDWVKIDLNYIDNWSFGLDIKILFKTLPAALRGTGM